MKKIFLVIADYKDEKQDLFENKISPINEAYCLKHGFEYMFVKKDTPPMIRDNPTWWKFTILQELLDKNQLNDGDVFTHLDADMVIVDDSTSYQTSKSFSYSIDNGNSHCMGNYTMTINDWSRKLVENVLKDEPLKKMHDDPEWRSYWATGGGVMREQGVWYILAGIQPHSWVPFPDLPNSGFHSKTTPEPVYSLEELEEHVEIRGPEWNCTLLAEEADDYISQSLQKYNIVRSKKEDIIIRHFAGGQRWREEYLNH
jgi:hypothetical protein